MHVVISEPGTDYRIPSDKRVCTPGDAADVAKEIRDSDTEAFAVLSLNTKNGLLGADVVTIGLLNASLVHPREVFRAALRRNAASIVLVHNHPSGDPSPSSEDIRITRHLLESGKVLDIPVLDHVILGKEPYSLCEHGIIDFT